jgi:hypothetical protein
MGEGILAFGALGLGMATIFILVFWPIACLLVLCGVRMGSDAFARHASPPPLLLL